MAPEILQVFSLGLIWTSVHCAGMCGPIVAGVAGIDRNASTLRRIRRVLEYQSGRAIAYGAFGAITGALGTIVDTSIFPYASFAAAIFFILIGFKRIFIGKKMASRPLSKWYMKIMRLARGKSPFFIGIALAIMPCSITFWVLGLAAASGDPLTGMWVMLSLVLITSPILMLAGSASALVSKVGSDKIIGTLLIVSGGWIAAKALADLKIIDHLSYSFRIFGEPFGLMFF